MKRCLRLASAFCLGLIALGCGVPETKLEESGADLEGTITLNGETVQFAMIIVMNDQKSTTGKIGSDGKFLVKNVPIGEVKVGVNTEAATGDFQSAAMSGGAFKGVDAKGKGKVDLKFLKVPSKYADPNTSGLKTTINKGLNTYNIKI